MLLGIGSDTHSNIYALKSVLKHMDFIEVDKKINLGNIVGYNAHPNECVETTVENFDFIIRGEYENAVINLSEADKFDSITKEAVYWNSKKLTEENKELLKKLECKLVIDKKLMFVNGSPASKFDHISNFSQAQKAFLQPTEDFDIAFVGHTHIPALWIKNKNGDVQYTRPKFSHPNSKNISTVTFVIPDTSKAIVNVGSIGQPRDGDQRATYVAFEIETRRVFFFKIPYQMEKEIAMLQKEGFPNEVLTKLLYGR